MIEKKGDIWRQFRQENQMVLVTTNNVIGANGLVMGKGIAKEAKDRLPTLPYHVAAYFNFNPHLWNNGDYYLYLDYTLQIGCVQTKRHWKNPSPIDLIERSIEELNKEARLITNQHITYNLPKPGCGLGGLDWESQVKPLCETLPNNVIIWSNN